MNGPCYRAEELSRDLISEEDANLMAQMGDNRGRTGVNQHKFTLD